MRKLLLMLLVAGSSVATADGNLSFEITPSGYSHDSDRYFSLGTAPTWQNRLDESLNLQWQYEGLSLLTGAELQQLRDEDDTAKGYLYELFYDFSLASIDFSVGKKRIGMGVGYAYRPLDMIQKEQRQALNVTDIDGVPLISAARFTETGMVSLLYVNHLQVNEELTSSGDEEWAVRGYNLINDLDLQWLLHHDSQRKTSGAVGFSWVSGEAFELHGSIRIQGEYQAEPAYLYNPISMTFDASPNIEQHGVVALLGMTWTSRNGLSVIVEYWQDSMAPDKSFWEGVISDLSYVRSGGAVTIQNAKQLSTLANRIEYGFDQSNLVQKSLFVRCAYDGDWADPSIDVTLYPDDMGYTLTLRAEREFYQSQNIEFGMRVLGGGRDSLMGNIGEDQQAYITWEYTIGI